jgi:hypothetical protein
VNTKGKSKAIVALTQKMIKTFWVLATRKTIYLDCDPVKYNIKLDRYEIVNCKKRRELLDKKNSD